MKKDGDWRRVSKREFLVVLVVVCVVGTAMWIVSDSLLECRRDNATYRTQLNDVANFYRGELGLWTAGRK